MEFQYSSIFGDLTKNVQLRFDAISEKNKRLFDNVIFEKYLDWDTPTVGLDFEELLGQYNIIVGGKNGDKLPINQAITKRKRGNKEARKGAFSGLFATFPLLKGG